MTDNRNLPRKAPPASKLPARHSLPGTPEHEEWIIGRITTLLSHFYIPDEDPRVYAHQMVDWVEALNGYPSDVISAACRDYLREGSRRPTIADILPACRKHMPPPTEVPTKDPPRKKKDRISPEKRAEIVREAGIKSPMLKRVLIGPQSGSKSGSKS